MLHSICNAADNSSDVSSNGTQAASSITIATLQHENFRGLTRAHSGKRNTAACNSRGLLVYISFHCEAIFAHGKHHPFFQYSLALRLDVINTPLLSDKVVEAISSQSYNLALISIYFDTLIRVYPSPNESTLSSMIGTKIDSSLEAQNSRPSSSTLGAEGLGK